MSSDRVHLDVRGGVAVVTLDHPPLNIYDLEMRDGLIEAFAAVRDIPDVGAMLLRADGPHFSAGADLTEFGSASSILEARRIRWDRDPWGLLWNLRVPTIAALHGVVLGSGLEMALLCDIRIASPSARLGLPETKVGMLPGAGGTQSLTRALGPDAALPLIALAEQVDAGTALQRGLVHRVCDRADDEAFGIAEAWAVLEPATRAAAVRLVRSAADLSLSEAIGFERRLARTLSAAPDQ